MPKVMAFCRPSSPLCRVMARSQVDVMDLSGTARVARQAKTPGNPEPTRSRSVNGTRLG